MNKTVSATNPFFIKKDSDMALWMHENQAMITRSFRAKLYSQKLANRADDAFSFVLEEVLRCKNQEFDFDTSEGNYEMEVYYKSRMNAHLMTFINKHRNIRSDIAIVDRDGDAPIAYGGIDSNKLGSSSTYAQMEDMEELEYLTAELFALTENVMLTQSISCKDMLEITLLNPTAVKELKSSKKETNSPSVGFDSYEARMALGVSIATANKAYNRFVEELKTNETISSLIKAVVTTKARYNLA
jgi:hypothetical protein